MATRKRSWLWRLGLLVLPCLTQCAQPERTVVLTAPDEVAVLEPASLEEQTPEPELTDADVLAAVEYELRTAVGAAPIDVRIVDGIVVLSGEVDNGLAAKRAVSAAQVVRRVRGVVSLLVVVAPDVPDQELEDAVRRALMADPATDWYELGVKANRGKVVLEGVVQSPTEQQFAEESAWSVVGAREVENRIRVAPVRHRADVEIKSDIERRLAIDPHLDDESVTVAISNGHVALEGEVGSAFEQSRAQAAGWVTGVRTVDISRVEIDSQPRDSFQRHSSPQPGNEELESAVLDALRIDPRVDEAGISVRAAAGTVELAGVVSSSAERRAAESDAHNAVGAWRVLNQLTVQAPYATRDDALAAHVRTRLREHPAVEADHLTVSVSNGRVRLEGSVRDEFERQQAQTAAASVPGVTEVENRLKIPRRSEPLSEDEQLERAIETALFWDPRVDESGVDVEVFEGIAIVAGTTPDQNAYDAVLENVRSAGPRAIDNRLRVLRMPAPNR